MQIAALVNSEGNTSGFDKNGVIKVYSKEECEWVTMKQMDYRTENMADSMALHTEIREICDWLGECKIIVVNRIRGIHYIAFEEKQVSMLEIGGAPECFLNDIRECINHQRTAQEVPMEHNTVFEVRPGIYHTDLREVMKKHTSYNSKQILLPFLKNNKYSLLEIICDHVPKWLETEQSDLKLRFSVEKYRECIKLKVYPSKTK